MIRSAIEHYKEKSEAVLSSEDESIRTLLHQIARSLLPKESAVIVDITGDGESYTATVTIAPEHLGRLIGEQGRIARSIRTYSPQQQ